MVQVLVNKRVDVLAERYGLSCASYPLLPLQQEVC